MDLEDLFHIIRKRGIFMQEAYPEGGAMMAVLGLDSGRIEEICRQTEGIVTIANYNCPGQIVITGEENAVAEAAKALSDAGAKRCVPLKVSGPFHSQLLKGAGERLEKELYGIRLRNPSIPYISNVDALEVTEAASERPGVQFRMLAADGRENDRGRRGHVHRDRPRKDAERFYEEDQQGCKVPEHR